jgi:hypothetical protein
MYIYICSHRISPCCSPCWWVFLRFSISSPGDFISFPHLFDHFINGFDQFSKPIWSVYHKKNVSHLFLHFVVWFISCPKFSQSISPVDHYSLSSVLQSFPNLLVHVIIGFHQFFPPISCVNHDVSWVLVVRSFIVSLDFINLPHQSLHCTIHFHQFSPTYWWFLSLVTRIYLFSPTTCSFYHWRSSFCPSIPWFYHEISISFPHLFVHLLTRFHQFSPHPGSFNHWFLLGFSISSFYPWISSCSRPIAMCVLCIIFI